jgi:hypothetical protein
MLNIFFGNAVTWVLICCNIFQSIQSNQSTPLQYIQTCQGRIHSFTSHQWWLGEVCFYFWTRLGVKKGIAKIVGQYFLYFLVLHFSLEVFELNTKLPKLFFIYLLFVFLTFLSGTDNPHSLLYKGLKEIDIRVTKNQFWWITEFILKSLTMERPSSTKIQINVFYPTVQVKYNIICAVFVCLLSSLVLCTMPPYTHHEVTFSFPVLKCCAYFQLCSFLWMKREVMTGV